MTEINKGVETSANQGKDRKSDGVGWEAKEI